MSKKSKIDPHRPLTAKELESLGPAMHGIEGLPKDAREAVKNTLRGRPKKENPKELISIRLDADIVKEFRSQGKGWQTTMNNVLREWIEDRPQA